MTEDMIQEQEQLMLELHEIEKEKEVSTNELSSIQKRMQASLLSDMESFKAANGENCILEDFVRWHSPKDWIVEVTNKKDQTNEEANGSLSTRMKQPGNIWIQLWNEARNRASDEQVQLFDCPTNAEKVLHYLEGLSVESILEQMVSVILENYFFILSDYVQFSEKQLGVGMSQITKQLQKFKSLVLKSNFLETEVVNELNNTLLTLEYYIYTAISIYKLVSVGVVIFVLD